MSAFLRRLGFFLVGLTIGIFILNVFFKKKNVEFDYLPNARTLKSIRSKPIVYSDKVIQYITQNQIDTTGINGLFYYGKVNFSKSETRTQPCKTYLIEPTSKTADFSITVERCDSIATVQDIQIVKK